MLPQGVKLPLRKHIKSVWERLLSDGSKIVVIIDSNHHMEYVLVTYK